MPTPSEQRPRRRRNYSFMLIALILASLNTTLILWRYSARPTKSSQLPHHLLVQEPVSETFDNDHRDDINDFPKWVQDYIEFHQGPNTNKTRYLVWVCTDNMPCGGIGDRARGIISSFYMALLTRRKLLIVNPDPVNISDVLRPASIDWFTDAATIANEATWAYHSVDHIHHELYNLASPAIQSHRVIIARTNYIIWPTIMNDPKLAEARNHAQLPHGNNTNRWNEMLFAWAWQALISPSEALVDDIGTLKQHTGLEDDFFAVHIRRGGHWGDPERYTDQDLLQKFIDCLHNMTDVIGQYPVYVTSDDVAAKEEFAKISTQHVVYDNSTQPFHVERTERREGFVERNRRAWAEYYLIAQSKCAIACGSGFSIWPVAMSRHPRTGTRCFARFELCSTDAIQRSMEEFIPVRI